jgi:hypothetical protein
MVWIYSTPIFLKGKKMSKIKFKDISNEKGQAGAPIDITPNWVTCGEIIIMALQNPKLDREGFDNVFANIRDMAQKMDQANKIIRQLKSNK